MRKKKIFIYIHQSCLKGGVEKVFFNLLNNLPQDVYEITVLSHIAYLSNDIYENLYPNNVRRKWLYYDEFSSKFFSRLKQRLHNKLMPLLYPLFLRFNRFDTAIAAQEGMYADFIIKKVKADRKLLWIHNDISICHWTQAYFGSTAKEKECYQLFDQIVCVSESVATSMRTVFGNLSNLCVCYNPIDTAEIDQKLATTDIRRDNLPLFVSVGRLVDQKGFDRLLRICRRLNEEHFKYRVWIIGEGQKRSELEEELSQGGLENVELLGNKSNPFPYMKCADWVICTSRHEGFNMVLHEAVWCGTPIITTNNAGAVELLGDSKYGIVTENDDDAFYRAMRQVLSDQTLLSHYKEAVQQRRSFIDLPSRVAAICSIL